MEKLITIKEHC